MFNSLIKVLFMWVLKSYRELTALVYLIQNKVVYCEYYLFIFIVFRPVDPGRLYAWLVLTS